MRLSGIKNVAAAGTAETLVPTTNSCSARYFSRITIQARDANTGQVYIGVGSASSAAYGARLRNNDSIVFGDGVKNDVDAAYIYLDVDTNGEGVSYIAEQA